MSPDRGVSEEMNRAGMRIEELLEELIEKTGTGQLEWVCAGDDTYALPDRRLLALGLFSPDRQGIRYHAAGVGRQDTRFLCGAIDVLPEFCADRDLVLSDDCGGADLLLIPHRGISLLSAVEYDGLLLREDPTGVQSTVLYSTMRDETGRLRELSRILAEHIMTADAVMSR